MKAVLKKINPFKVIHAIVLLFFIIFVNSCKKENTILTPTVSSQGGITNVKNTIAQPILEKVDSQLLIQYVNYESKIEAIALINQSIIQNSKANLIANTLTATTILPDTVLPKMSTTDFEAMINNFLANERNAMRLAYYQKNNNLTINFVQECYDEDGNVIQCGDDGDTGGDTGGDPGGSSTGTGGTIGGGGSGGSGSNPITCTGTFTVPNGAVSTVSSILFQAILTTVNTISTASYSFGGVYGTWTSFGSLYQTQSQGVITYQQYYNSSFTLNGVTYNQHFLIYGNIYNGACTVHGMQIVPSPNQ